jgi:hypothetical protein
MVLYSDEEGCAALLLRLIPFYIAADFSEEELIALEAEDVYAVWYNENKLQCNDPRVADDVKIETSIR